MNFSLPHASYETDFGSPGSSQREHNSVPFETEQHNMQYSLKLLEIEVDWEVVAEAA